MCSMERNSWRRRRASFTASEKACSRALLIRMALRFFHAAAQRVLVGARELVGLLDLRLRDLAGKDAGDADPFAVYVEHDLHGERLFVVEHALQHVDHEL